MYLVVTVDYVVNTTNCKILLDFKNTAISFFFTDYDFLTAMGVIFVLLSFTILFMYICGIRRKQNFVTWR